MTDVIDLKHRRELKQLQSGLHLTGRVRCLNPECSHEWEAVTPVDVAMPLECEKCHLMRGIWIYNFEPENHTHRLICGNPAVNCKSEVFMLLRNGAFCVGCGRMTSYTQLAEVMAK